MSTRKESTAPIPTDISLGNISSPRGGGTSEFEALGRSSGNDDSDLNLPLRRSSRNLGNKNSNTTLPPRRSARNQYGNKINNFRRRKIDTNKLAKNIIYLEEKV